MKQSEVAGINFFISITLGAVALIRGVTSAVGVEFVDLIIFRWGSFVILVILMLLNFFDKKVGIQTRIVNSGISTLALIATATWFFPHSHMIIVMGAIIPITITMGTIQSQGR